MKLISWFLDILDKEMRILYPKNKKQITENFKGEISIHIYHPLKDRVGFNSVPEIKKSQYVYLTLEIPPTPMYKTQNQQDTLKHISIYQLLKKFDGITPNDDPTSRKVYKINKLPKYLIINIKRFYKNNIYLEKNNTIVQFPLVNLNMSKYVILEDNQTANYNIVANICHQGPVEGGSYKIHVKNKSINQWFEIQDLHIKQVLPEVVGISEAYIQIYELNEDDINQ